MKQNFLRPVLALFLLVPASIIWAQTVNLTGTVTMEQDYRVVNFSSEQGNLKVFLPGVLASAATGTINLTGTVTPEPAGKTEKEKRNNLKALQKLVLSVGGSTVPVLAGPNQFTFPVPAGITNPITANVFNGKDNTTLELKNPCLPPPPLTIAPFAGQATLMTDQKVFLNNGNIPIYAANNTALLFQPTDKFFLKDASGKTMQATVLTQSPTQTVLSLPHGFQNGAATVTRQAGNRTDQANFSVVTLNAFISRNNLNKGETATATFQIDQAGNGGDGRETMQIPTILFDIRNLTPNIVNLSGGDLQVLHFPTQPGSTSPADWQVLRTVTGVTPGIYDISATLYPSSDVSTNTANTQKRSLATCDQFNKWIASVKTYLNDLLANATTEAARNQITQALQGLPYCTSDENLELDKATADIALRFFTIPNQDLSSGLPALAAYDAAATNIMNTTAANPCFVHTDVIRDGLNYIQHVTANINDSTLMKNITTAKEANNALQNDYSGKNVSLLITSLKDLDASHAIASILDGLQVNQPVSKKELPPHTRIAYLDPFKNLFYIYPQYEEEVLNSFGANKEPDGKYLVHCTSYTNQPVTVSLSIVPASLSMLNLGYFADINQNIPPIFLNNNKGDSTKKKNPKDENPLLIDPILPIDLGLKFVNEDKKEEGPKEPTHGYAYYDSATATVYNVFTNARCQLAMKGYKTDCAANRMINEYSGNPRYHGEHPKNYDEEFGGKENNAGQFMKIEVYDHYNCEAGGNEICKSKAALLGLKYIYADKDCKKLVNVMKITGFTCD